MLLLSLRQRSPRPQFQAISRQNEYQYGVDAQNRENHRRNEPGTESQIILQFREKRENQITPS